MSTEYYLMKGINKKDLLQKTDIKITNHPNTDGIELLEDKYGNILHINTVEIRENKDSEPYVDMENIRELSRYGDNNPTYILDTLIKEFKILYYTDNGLHKLILGDSNLDVVIFEDMFLTHGYNVTNIGEGSVIIPLREEHEYQIEN
jgi:hypothetical protein